MNLLIRFLWVLLRAFVGKKTTHLADPSVLHLQTWPNDLDVNGHMNNGRYLSIMDLGRIDLTVRLGFLKPIFKFGWRPVVASIMIRYRRSLNPFQSFELHTRIVSWDHKWFYMEQKFVRHKKTVAIALVKGVFVGQHGNVPIEHLLREIGIAQSAPPLPAAFREWQQAEKTMLE